MLASFRQTHRLALVQKMGAQGDDRLAGLQRAGHPRGFIIQAEHSYRLPGDGGRTRGNAPDARAVTRIVYRRQGHRQHLAWRLVVADAQGHGRPQRGIRQRAVQYIARFKGAGGGVSRVRKQAQGRRDRLRFAAIACRQPPGAASPAVAPALRAAPPAPGGSPPARR